jgi:cell division protein ZipA
MEVVPRESPDQAAARSAKLRNFKNEVYTEVIVVLKAESEFNSKDFWNTLVDLGLRWGDGDLFHWENSKNDIGGDFFFSVWTSTDPGYFLPEQIVSGRFKPRDLIFGFSVPRSADPESVFEMMIESVENCREKLGGVILDENGNSFDKKLHQVRIRDSMLRMKEEEFDQGQGLTLRIF